MTNVVNRFYKLYVLLYLILAFSGCSLGGLAVPAAVSGSAAGVNYTITNIAYKTISYPIADIDAALDKTLKKMDIKETGHNVEEGKVSITAVAGSLDIYIDLEKITKTETSMKVNAKKGVFLKDKATAAEIIVQTEKSLEVKK